jgi:hypothetical protein
MPSGNQRGEYRTVLPSNGMHLGIMGVGLVLGLAAWPSVKKRNPLGFIAMSASGGMVSLGLTQLLFRDI